MADERGSGKPSLRMFYRASWKVVRKPWESLQTVGAVIAAGLIVFAGIWLSGQSHTALFAAELVVGWAIISFLALVLLVGPYRLWRGGMVEIHGLKATLVASESAAPVIRGAEDLEVDRNVRVFRWRLWNVGGGSTRPEVTITHAITRRGRWLFDQSQAPIELQWTNEAQGVRPDLSKAHGQGKSVGVLGFNQYSQLAVVGARHAPALNGGAAVAFKFFVRVEAHVPEAPGSQPVSRWFSFEPRPKAPLVYRVRQEKPHGEWPGVSLVPGSLT